MRKPHQDKVDDTSLEERYKSIPDAIRDQDGELGKEALNAHNQHGLPKLELIYHLLPGDDDDDRRLGSMCTISEVENEFDVSRRTAGKKIRELVSSGVLDKHPDHSSTYCINEDYWSVIDESNELASMRTDGGVQTASDITLSYGKTSQQASVENGTVRASDEVDLIDFSTGSPIAPIIVGAVYCLLSIHPGGASLPIVGGLVAITVWVLYECAKLPTRLPLETLRVVRSKQIDNHTI